MMVLLCFFVFILFCAQEVLSSVQNHPCSFFPGRVHLGPSVCLTVRLWRPPGGTLRDVAPVLCPLAEVRTCTESHRDISPGGYYMYALLPTRIPSCLLVEERVAADRSICPCWYGASLAGSGWLESHHCNPFFGYPCGCVHSLWGSKSGCQDRGVTVGELLNPPPMLILFPLGSIFGHIVAHTQSKPLTRSWLYASVSL